MHNNCLDKPLFNLFTINFEYVTHVFFLNRDVDFSGMRVNEILVNRRPMENITIQGMKVIIFIFITDTSKLIYC